jgi:cell division protein ZapE
MTVMTPMERYRAELENGQLQADAAQHRTVEHTQRLYQALLDAEGNGGGWFARLRRRFESTARQPVRGLYLWGGVGRGKTHIVNGFFAALPFADKQRVHFHSFMQLVHARLAALGHRQDPLAAVAGDLASVARVICFDEFHVSDITDAMLLSRLLQALFGHGVTLVATSNIAPDELYRDGLQREQFLSAIELIKEHTEVVHLDSQVDYRLRVLERAEIYHHPLDEQAEAGLLACFEALGPENVRIGEELRVAGRGIATKRLADGILWVDFTEICETPRSASDYIDIARCYHTVLISDVPFMDDEQRDRVIRFIHLVDELYEHNVNLVISAAAPPEEIYSGRHLAERFARAESRLMEMQTRAYLAAKHLP